MNKVQIFNNKAIPFEWDDIDWFQNSVRDAFAGLLSMVGDCIISGCVVTTTVEPYSVEITAGFISLDGEILTVDAQVLNPDLENRVVFEVEETNDATGSEQDSNGATVECYKIRKAIIVDVPDSSGMFEVATALLMTDRIKVAILPFKGWIIATPAGDYGFTDIAVAEKLKYRLDNFNCLQIIGQIKAEFTPGPANLVCTTIPPTYRPNVDRFVPVVKYTSTTPELIFAFVKSNGEIELSPNTMPITDQDIIYFNALIPL